MVGWALLPFSRAKSGGTTRKNAWRCAKSWWRETLPGLLALLRTLRATLPYARRPTSAAPWRRYWRSLNISICPQT